MTSPTCDGLDLHGSYQPVSDWNAIPQFAVMSVKATEGASVVQRNGHAYMDAYRQRNFQYRGVYHWLRSDATPRSQFDNVRRWWDQAGGMRPGEFIQNDWERTVGIEDPHLDQVLEFNSLCQSEWPNRLIVYVGNWITNFHEWLATNPIERIWLANYNVNAADPRGGWLECAKYNAPIWQYTSSFNCPGITTRCDANHVFDFKALDLLAGYEVAQQPQPIQAVPLPTPTFEEDDTMDIVTNSETFLTSAPLVAKFVVKADGSLRHITYTEWVARGSLSGNPLSNAQITELTAS